MAEPTPSSQKSPPLTHREKLFSYQHPSLQRKSSLPAPKPTPPLHFLDRHLSKSLILKRVELLPFLHTEVFAGLNSFSKELDALRDPQFRLPFWASTMTRGAGASDIIGYRFECVESAPTKIASSLAFHPSEPDLWGWLRWINALVKTTSSLIVQDYASQNLLLEVAPPPPDELETFSRKHRDLLKRLRTHTALLTSCMVFCTDALPLMEEMERLGSMDVFPWRFDSDYSSDSREKTPPPDATEVPWTLPKSTGPRRSRRVRYQDVLKPAHTLQDIGVIERPEQNDSRYKPACDDYVQKAWVAAVRNDATAIIFDCGNFLRIGVRHRERQTLFLSSLIDIRTCKDPSYGGLWTALHVAIASDAMQRLPLLENALLGKRKSTVELEPHRPSKASKIDDPPSGGEELLLIDKAMAAYMDKFPVLAVFFRFDYLDSPAPLLLFQPDSERKTRYEPTEYLKVIAYKQLGSGSVGTPPTEKTKGSSTKAGRSSKPTKGKAKGAKPSSDSLTHRPFILKVAPTDTRARRLQHEVQVYRHLHDAGVSGIPSVLSYREGVNADLRVLMLSDAGRSLGYRMDSDKKVDLSAEAGAELKSILTAIHEAGVLHRDVRSWNIMEDDFGRVRFTDFDRSSFRGTGEDYQAEKERLDRFIAGEFVDKDDIIGADDLRRHRAPN
ncbi:hypothetical protein BDZ89DRAFT_1060638 [Hymenopellis radicata]|nr:hypothetical protein BDZ89DRAFT_1060638 [Hymenopellis radicata]